MEDNHLDDTTLRVTRRIRKENKCAKPVYTDLEDEERSKDATRKGGRIEETIHTYTSLTGRSS